MKKIVLLVAAAVALTACGGNAQKKAQKTAADAATEKAAVNRAQMSGSYTEMRAVTAADKAVFDEATRGLVGVTYTPDSVATQIVNGTNYKFICKAVTATREPETYRAEVIVYKPVKNEESPVITSIRKIGGETAAAQVSASSKAGASRTTAPGSYTDQRALTDADKAIFNEAMKGLVGVTYTPESVATQVVAGTNYKFICKGEMRTPDRKTFKAEVTIYQPLPNSGDKPYVTQIVRIDK